MTTPIFAEKISKEEIAQMEVEEYKGRIITILTPEEAEKAVSYLMQFPALGIDTETRPCFQKGKSYIVSLLQVSTADTCFLFRLNHIGLPQSILSLLQSEKVLKIGLSLHDDFHALQKRAEIKPSCYVDLQKMVGQFGIQEASLQKIYAILFGKKISKRQRLTNWEADILSEPQKRYAALDAWACLHIYNYLNQATFESQIE